MQVCIACWVDVAPDLLKPQPTVRVRSVRGGMLHMVKLMAGEDSWGGEIEQIPYGIENNVHLTNVMVFVRGRGN